MLAAIVDWGALGEVVAYSFAGTLVLTGLFTTGVLCVEADAGRRPGSVRRAVAALAFALCLGLLVFGLYTVFSSK